MLRLSPCFVLLLLPWLSGCHNPARQTVPQVQMGEREVELRKALAPGLRADRALGYLLTQGYEVRVTRDEKARVERIVAKRRDASQPGGTWQVDLAIEDDRIQTAEINPH